MKKFLFSLVVSATIVSSFSGCGKVVDQINQLFSGVDVNAPEMQLTIPIIPIVPQNELSLGSITQSFNLDSIIRANTGNTFSIKDVSSVKVKQITVRLLNSNNNNNLSNLEYAKITLSSNNNSTAASLATLNFPDVAASTFTVTPTESPELLTYLSGSQITYNIAGKVRRTTTQPLSMVVTVTLRVK